MLRRLFLISLLTFLIPPLMAQEITKKEVNNQAQFWTSINSTWRLADRWGLMGDVHVRRTNFIQDPNFYFLRLGGVYWFNDKLSLAGGGALLWLAVPNETGGFDWPLERRIYQQMLWRTKFGKTGFLHRIRNEQRWHEVLNEEGEVDRIRFSNRVRFLFSLSFQIFQKETLPKLVVSDEILFHFGKEIVYNTFDQNRLFIGINHRLNPSWSFDFGYMSVFQQRYSGYQYDHNHTLRLFFYYSPDLRKKKNKDLPHYPVSDLE